MPRFSLGRIAPSCSRYCSISARSARRSAVYPNTSKAVPRRKRRRASAPNRRSVAGP
ncbi:Uncharacterised protein [Bordetella pertussis]|nr:Uncharacterised protein [Bordetella pertussis]CFW40470.1 Uncharacterised protein [Bordetella pertussis]